MKCPKCLSKMKEDDVSGVLSHRCGDCFGVWVSARSLNRLLQMEGFKTDVQSLFRAGESDVETGHICPECDGVELSIRHAGDVELDVCGRCSGVFFDHGELMKILPNKHKKYTDTVDYQLDKLDWSHFLVTIFTSWIK